MVFVSLLKNYFFYFTFITLLSKDLILILTYLPTYLPMCFLINLTKLADTDKQGYIRSYILTWMDCPLLIYVHYVIMHTAHHQYNSTSHKLAKLVS